MARPHVEQTALPGIGTRHELTTQQGRRIGVVSHRSGLRELVIYDPEDPDGASDSLNLNDEEADALADILDASRVLGQLAALDQQTVGLITEHVHLDAGTPFVGRKLGDTQMRTRTGSSIVAVLRGGQALASPGPSFTFETNDVVIVVGTYAGTSHATAILTGHTPQ